MPILQGSSLWQSEIMNQFESADFKKLKHEWYRKLKDHGFKDIEDKRGNLFVHNTRTISWKNQERIKNFYLKLDSYISNSTLPESHKQVLEMWSTGIYLVDIAKNVNKSLSYVKGIAYLYRNLVLESESE